MTYLHVLRGYCMTEDKCAESVLEGIKALGVRASVVTSVTHPHKCTGVDRMYVVYAPTTTVADVLAAAAEISNGSDNICHARQIGTDVYAIGRSSARRSHIKAALGRIPMATVTIFRQDGAFYVYG